MDDEFHYVLLMRLIERSCALIDRTHDLTVMAATTLRRVARDNERQQGQEIERQVLRELVETRYADERSTVER